MLDTLELDLNTSKLGSSVDFAKMTGQAAYYKQAVHGTVWANSVRIGMAQPFDNSRVPLSEAFFHRGREFAAWVSVGWRRAAATGGGLQQRSKLALP